MAIIDDDGKIRGAIGNYVYRRVNKKGVIQSHPGRLEPKGDTILENKRFGGASKINKVIYPYIKRSGLNMCYSYLYGKLVNYFKRVMYTDLLNREKGEYLFLDEDNCLAKIFPELPIAEKNGDILTVRIPEANLTKGNRRFAKAEFMEYRIQLWHMDYKLSGVSCLYNTIQDRLYMGKEIEAQEITIDLSKLENDVILNEKLSELGVSLEGGLLVMCFGINLFEYSQDFVSLNSKKLNPAGILGAWQLGGEVEE